MQAEYKTIHRVFFAWNYPAEIEYLNKASEEGLQLVHGGCYSSKFINDPDVRYRYQIDYGKIEDMGRYIETFREQGWEYINSTFNNWHYFRKAYDPTLPEEAYEIFTDRQSLNEMTRRWSRLALLIAFLAFCGNIMYLIDLIKRPSLPAALSFTAILIEVIVLVFGAIKIGKADARRNVKGDTALFTVFLVVLLAGLISGLTLKGMRPSFWTSQQASSIDKPKVESSWADFTVKYADNYYLDLEMRSEKPMTFKVMSEKDGEIFSKTTEEFSEKDIRLKLPAGNYWLNMSAESGYFVDCKLQ